MLKLSNGLQILEKTNARGLSVPCSIVFCTADRNRGTGGEIIALDSAILSRKIKKGVKGVYSGLPSKNQPSHHKNRTRNIMAVGTTEIRKVHIDLILSINGEAIA